MRAILTSTALLFSSILLTGASTNSNRTVMDTELGSIFQPAQGFPNSDFGAYMGAGSRSTMFAPETIKGHYMHFNHFGIVDNGFGFPYSTLRDYEAQEVAAGRAPIFVTATYQGKKRPVMFKGYLELDANNKPTAPQSNWVYAVNVADDRFIKFWINHYARPVVLQSMNTLGNVWAYMDGCAFYYAAYGVLDDSGTFVGGVPWDAPFQQNANEYLKSIADFFNRLKQLAPDINVITDVGSMTDPSQFQNIYANVGGALAEDVLAWYSNPTQTELTGFYNMIFPWFSWLGSTGRVGILGALLSPNWKEADLLTGFVVYELLKGPNFFFATRGAHVPPGDWERWNAALGTPVAAYQEGPANGQPANRLYWRQYEDGYVYLNWTGSTQAVTLPTGKWVDPYNHAVTEITIPNLTATFVTWAHKQAVTAQAPSIEPRCPEKITGPLTVTISTQTPGGTIYYTLDGSNPSFSSAVYSGPFQLNSSAVVKARAVASGYNTSLTSTNSYTISTGAPTMEFSISSDKLPASGAAAVTTYYPVLALSAMPNEPVTANYTVLSPSGKTSTGSVKFVAREVYQQFPISISGSGTWKITLTGASGAVLGSRVTFEFSAD
ncbi:MAG: chitobiase/beta-hexosaminidase C-terminal domain-containing protein [Acidobacteriaceae bacterium]|nr:chitobiase/beta-hexosaminidase C-terminal domain-containing protein [Acidobacteriaceae bacterium]MBV9779966.1 chitobiase/beta-hexosaminidase C-terminal domain-containing protein [Acidobacteriaceae bacterium]